MTYHPEPNRYEDATFRRVGRSGLKLPAISFGLWHNFGDTTPLETQRSILSRPSILVSRISTSPIIMVRRLVARK